MAIRLLIADDDPLIRESLKIILNMDENFDVVRVVDNGEAAVDSCLKDNIDVALLDVRMPVLNGVLALKEIKEKTKCKTLILTTFDEEEYIKDAIKLGVNGYILKNNTPDKIKEAIKVVYGGNSIMQDVVMQKIALNLTEEKEVNNKELNEKFSEREIDIMREISEGLSNKEIANKLFISEGTVKNYITNILTKTNLNHRTQIAIFYLKGKIK